MKEFIKKYYSQLIIIALLLGAIGYAFFESRQIMVMIGEKSVELKQVQLDRVITAEYMQNIHIFKKSSEYIDENIGIFDIVLPNTDNAKVELFSDLEQMATGTGHEKVVLTVRQKDEKKKAAESKDPQVNNILGINITIIGTYNELLQYVHKIENMKYISTITSFDIKKMSPDLIQREGIDLESEGVSDLVKTNMVIDFYLLGEEG